MNNRIYDAFDQIHAEPELKESTRRFLKEKTRSYRRRPAGAMRFAAVCAACFLFLFLAGGSAVFMTPVSTIQIDINPSLLLSVNRFDRIVKVEGLNTDGEEVADNLDIRYMKYTDAVTQLLENDKIAECLSLNKVMNVTVCSSTEEDEEAIVTQIQSCTGEHQNIRCHGQHQGKHDSSSDSDSSESNSSDNTSSGGGSSNGNSSGGNGHHSEGNGQNTGTGSSGSEGHNGNGNEKKRSSQ